MPGLNVNDKNLWAAGKLNPQSGVPEGQPSMELGCDCIGVGRPRRGNVADTHLGIGPRYCSALAFPPGLE